MTPTPDRATPDRATPGRAVPELGEYAEAVLDVVDQVPAGSVTTYGRIARALVEAGLGGGPRSVGAVMSAHGSAVAWWRVLPADGSPPVCDPSGAAARWREEGTPMRRRGLRVDLSRAVVDPVAPDWVHDVGDVGDVGSDDDRTGGR